MKKILAVLFSLFLFKGIEASTPLSLYFTPNAETDQIIIGLVRQAEQSVYIASYSFSWDLLAQELNKKNDCLDVKIIADSKPPADLRQAKIKVDETSALFHPKLMIIDNRHVAIGSGNFTESGFLLHHNHFLCFEDAEIAGFLARKFNAWWTGETVDEEYSAGGIRIAFSPENNCEGIISRAVASAKSTIHFAFYHFTSEEIAKIIIERKLAGVKVYGIIENSSVEPYSVFGALRDFGCAVRRSNRAGFLHDKFIVVDNRTVIAGSYNLTAAARKNTEVIMAVEDERLASEFMREWKRMWRYYSLP